MTRCVALCIVCGVSLCLLAAGCHEAHRQSMVHPAGPGAAMIANLWWWLFGVLTTVFVVTILLAGIAILRSRRESPLGQWFIVVSGIVVPGVILTGLLFLSLRASARTQPPEDALIIQITGHQWWWGVRYPDLGITIANELYIPVGTPVRLELLSADVIHSFWVPNLHGKLDLLPDHINVLYIQADQPGVYRGQCAEYCGVQHTWMALEVMAVQPAEFAAWVNARTAPPPPDEPTDPLWHLGRQVYTAAGCHTCHAIDDHQPMTPIGPDLTHIANRRTLGAGLMPNTPENLRDWIVDSQAFKPGNLMPPTPLSEQELQALVTYLRSLE